MRECAGFMSAQRAARLRAFVLFNDRLLLLCWKKREQKKKRVEKSIGPKRVQVSGAQHPAGGECYPLCTLYLHTQKYTRTGGVEEEEEEEQNSKLFIADDVLLSCTHVPQDYSLSGIRCLPARRQHALPTANSFVVYIHSSAGSMYPLLH